MLSTFTRRLPSVFGICRRSLITQPVVIQQGDGTVPIFLNPPSAEDRAFSDKLRSTMASNNVDLDTVDLKIFQIKQENYEFDPPALPREQSSSWGYLWGNRLVRSQKLLETLKPEDEYLRGFLEKTTSELKRKMKVHYPNVDWESRLANLNNKSSFDTVYTEAKIQALADLAKDDTEGYVNMYRNNSYISSFDDSDDFGYNVPAAMEAKLENLMKFDWDKTVDNPEVSSYMTILGGLCDMMEPRLKAIDPKLGATLQNLIKSHLSSSTADLAKMVDVLTTSSASIVGEAPSGLKSKVASVVSTLKATGAVKPADANAIVSAFRGLSSASEAAFIKGKTDADLQTQFADCDETRLDNLCLAANACNNITDANAAQLIMSGLFNNVPYFFRQFIANPENVAKFASVNGAALDNTVAAVQANKANSVELAKALDGASTAVETWLTSTLSMDKATVSSVSAELPALIMKSGKQSEKWFGTLLDEYKSSASPIDKVEADTVMGVFNSVTPNMAFPQLYHSIMCPAVGNYSGKSLMMASCNENFSSDLAENLAASLVSNGRCTPAQALQISSGVGRLPEMKAVEVACKKTAEGVKNYATCVKSVKWMVEEDSLPGLMMAYDSVPHPSFDNVNAY